jgi:MEMO1 family protein
MKKIILLFLVLALSNFTLPQNSKIRQPVDTVGFASKPGQMDEFLKRVNEMYKDCRKSFENWKVAISPHDDYTYVGCLYPELLSNVNSRTIILIGVCHKVKLFNLENKIIFDSYTQWKMPYGNIPVSKLREEIISGLPENSYIIHDSIQALEHSVEAIVPFLQFYNMHVEIISILVPYMPYDKMNEIAEPLANAVFSAVKKNNMQWGKDFAIVISSDAVHYGDEDWGGKNYAPFGADTNGYIKAVEYEKEIINACLTGKIEKEKIEKFINYTVNEKDYKDYKWTWCGRYSVPLGLLTSFYLQNLFGINLEGNFVGYSNSIDHLHIPVSDIGMGTTAPANIRHWVGYPAIGYK